MRDTTLFRDGPGRIGLMADDRSDRYAIDDLDGIHVLGSEGAGGAGHADFHDRFPVSVFIFQDQMPDRGV